MSWSLVGVKGSRATSIIPVVPLHDITPNSNIKDEKRKQSPTKDALDC